MSRPKFEKRMTREFKRVACAGGELDGDLFPGHGSGLGADRWSADYWREIVEEISGDDIDDRVSRQIGKMRFKAYLHRRGAVGVLEDIWEEVPLHHFCCDQWEVIPEVRRDRHGNFRPETVMDMTLMAMQHWYVCEAASLDALPVVALADVVDRAAMHAVPAG